MPHSIRRRHILAGLCAAGAVSAILHPSAALAEDQNDNPEEGNGKSAPPLIDPSGADVERASAFTSLDSAQDEQIFHNRPDGARFANSMRSIPHQISASGVAFSNIASEEMADIFSIDAQIAQDLDQTLDAAIQGTSVKFVCQHVAEVYGGRFQLLTYLVERILSPQHVWAESVNYFIHVADDGSIAKVLRVEPGSWDYVADITKGAFTDNLARLDAESAPSEEFNVPEFTIDDMSREEADGSIMATCALGSDGRKKAAAYALKYWKNCNTAYRIFSGVGGDCTNFVSQCMRAGGWTDVAGLWKSDGAWWYNSLNQSHPWINVGKFRTFALRSGRSKSASYVTQLYNGNVLQVRPTTTWAHSVIVTGRSGTTPLLTYHSSSTQDKPFSAFRRSYNEGASGFKWQFHLT